MINFDSRILDKLQTPQGQQSVLLLEVDWVDGGTITYSDSTHSDAKPYLISAGQINRRSFPQSTNAIQIVLDATHEDVRNIFDSIDIHLRPARLYLTFPGVDAKALLFEGVINSEVSFGDQDRTLQFEVLSKLEESLVGFALEDGYFPVVAPEDRNKPWPLPFGTNCNFQARRLTTTIKGFLTEGQGVVDPTLAPRICQINLTQCPKIQRENSQGELVTSTDENCLSRKRNEGCILKDLLAQQQATVKAWLTVRGGEQFPQNKKITIRAGQVTYTGVMTGETFAIHSTTHPDEDKVAQCRPVKPLSYGYRYGIGSEEEANKCSNHGRRQQVETGAFGQDNGCFRISSIVQGSSSWCPDDNGGTERKEKLVGGSRDSWAYYDSMPTGRYIYLPAGTEVVLTEYDDDLIYMVSLLPGTVTQVCAYRTFGDLQLLTQVPTDWYEVVTVDYGGYECVELRFNTLPSAVDDNDQAGWSDDIYVSFVSSVGPNPVDIIEWLVNNYTDFSIDSANFAAVKTKLEQFPSNFVVQDRPNALRLIQDIAYQARMGVRVVNNEIQLVYLPEEPTAVRTLSAKDITLGSFVVRYTPTESLVTNHKINWRDSYAPQRGDQETLMDFSIRYNIPKYGSIEEEYDFYTQTNFATINKAATFWLIRKANTWREVEFETTLEHLDLDVMDAVTLNLAPQFPAGTKIVLTDKTLDTENNVIRWRAWTPIRAGETTPYYWAWPSGVTAGTFPLIEDLGQAGDGSGKEVVPPIGHPLRVGFVEGESEPVSSGDSFPSDVGFTAPVKNCQVPLGNEIQWLPTPILDPLARQQFVSEMEEKQAEEVEQVIPNIGLERPKKEKAPASDPTRREVGDEPENTPELEEDQSSCVYIVHTNWYYPALIGTGCGGPCSPTNVNGVVCTHTNDTTVRSVFFDYAAAEQAAQRHRALWQAYRCKAKPGVMHPAPGVTIISSNHATAPWYNSEAPESECPKGDGEPNTDPIYEPEVIEGVPPDENFDPGSMDPMNPKVGGEGL